MTTDMHAVVSQGSAPGSGQPPRRRVALSRRTKRAVAYSALVLAALVVLLPFAWMVVSSLKSDNEVFAIPIQWLPKHWHWHHYVDIWNKSNMATWLGNTLLLAVVVTVLQVLTGSFAAYGFTCIRFPGRDVLFFLYIATLAVPWQAYMIPQFVLFSKLHLSDSRWSIIALQAFGAFGVFLMRQYYQSIPDELIEAARVDGLSEYGIFRRIMVPLSMPAMASLALITFATTWNDYMGPLIYLRSPSLWTVQLGLQSFIGQYNADYALIATGSVLSVVPMAVIFLLGQRSFVQGVATTGLKG